MGNSKSQTVYPDEINQNYIIYKEIQDDPNFGDCSIIIDRNTNSKYFLKQFIVNSKDEIESLENEYKQKQKNQSTNVLNIQEFFTTTYESTCSRHYKFNVLYEYVDENISQMIIDHNSGAQVRKYLTEQQIWSILNSYISAFAYCQNKKLIFGDIKPKNLKILNKLTPKVIDFTSNSQSFYNSFLNKDIGEIQANHYPSPQLLECYKQKDRQQTYNSYKNDVFGLGLSMIELASLQSQDNIYDYTNLIMNQVTLRRNLNDLNFVYSDHLISFLKRMVVFDEDQRPDFLQLKEFSSDKQSIHRMAIENNQQGSVVNKVLNAVIPDQREQQWYQQNKKQSDTRASPIMVDKPFK